MGKNKKKWERKEKKRILMQDKNGRKGLQSQINWLVSKGKTTEAGLLIQKYKSKYE